MFLGAKVPGPIRSGERKFQGARRPGSEKARERTFQGANWPGFYWPIRSRERIGPGAKRLWITFRTHVTLLHIALSYGRYYIVTYRGLTRTAVHRSAKRILCSPTTSHVGATADDDDIRRDNADYDSTLSTGRCIQPHSLAAPSVRPSVRRLVRPRGPQPARPPARKQLASIETALGQSQ